MAELIPYDRVHVVGAGGAGMSGLAKLLAQAGHAVTGSDLKPGPLLTALEGAGVETWLGSRPETAASADLVVASSAVPDSDPELTAARRAGVTVWARPRLLEELTRKMRAVGTTGTHGKTTSAALAVAAVRAAGRDPSFMVGGQLIDLNTNAHLGADALFLLEADEAFGTFLGLSLDALLITNVEPDHLDHYRTVEGMEAAYADVAQRVSGPLVGCIDDPGVRRLRSRVPEMITYGADPAADWRLAEVGSDGLAVRAVIDSPVGSLRIRIPRPGEHVAANATGVLALVSAMGLDASLAARGLERFGGVRRRFEVRARRGGVVIVDDYAHHPTEVAATIEAARAGHPGRLVAAFQPHRYTRTREHAVALGESLGAADLVFVTDVYAAGEAPIPGVTGRLVATAVPDAATVHYVARRADLAGSLAAVARPGDMVLLLGAGDVTQVADELAPLLAGS